MPVKVRRTLTLAVTGALAFASANAQSVQYRSPTGVEYRSQADTGAIARAEQALVSDPRNPQRFVDLAVAQSGVRQFREAIQTLTRGLAVSPNNALLLRWRGHRYLSIREFGRALADLTRGARLDSTIYGIWYHLGVVRFVRGEFGMAADAFRRAQPIAPDAGELTGSTDWLWMSLSRAGRSAEAKAMLARRPDSLPIANAYARRLKLYRGEIGPDDVFTPADTADVQVATLSYGIGNWYLVHGDTAKARTWFERSIKSGGWPGFGFIVSEVELKRTSNSGGKKPPTSEPLRYSVDLSDRTGHVFAVTLDVDSLAKTSDVFQFASTAPGTYQVMDIGRFVRSFQALDERGKVIPAERISTNQWRIADPRMVRRIRYSVIATRDTLATEHSVYPMCGTALRPDHAMINGQAVFGFPRGMQASPISIRLTYPTDWKIGTALRLSEGRYHADNFDQLVDSPMLLGRLTSTRVDVTGVPVDIFVFSRTDQITAPQLGTAMSSMLFAAGGFLGRLPVDRYVFLFDFGDPSAGAWEHSYSSEYVLNEAPFSPAVGAGVTDISAHEFFHVVTPLNIHSEIIEHFNFETPVPSQHLWLYEGTTEWAAHKMQLEAGIKMPDAYLASLVTKIRSDRLQFDTTYSLSKLARTSFSDAGQAQYGNIYQRGAVVAGLLDIKLLEISGGKHGLRDLITELSRTYGKQRAFPEDSLFDVIVRKTSPQVRDFVTRYIQGAERPPVREYYAKLGITLAEDSTGMPLKFVVDPNPTPDQLRLRAAWLGKPIIIP